MPTILSKIIVLKIEHIMHCLCVDLMMQVVMLQSQLVHNSLGMSSHRASRMWKYVLRSSPVSAVNFLLELSFMTFDLFSVGAQYGLF